jgi:hypothetical protein
MIVPPIANRREIDRKLVAFFRQHRAAAFRSAISAFCRYYNVKRPVIEWYEYIDWGKTAGKTFEDGRIHLVHPENWKRGRVYKSERMWIQMLYHEMGHYLFWTDAERKADSFALRMVRGLRRIVRRREPCRAERSFRRGASGPGRAASASHRGASQLRRRVRARVGARARRRPHRA